MYIAGRREVTELQIEKVLGRIADEKNLKKRFSWQREREGGLRNWNCK